MIKNSTQSYSNGWLVVLAGAFLCALGLALAGLCGYLVVTVPGDEMPLAIRAAIVGVATFPLGISALGGWLTFAGHRTIINADTGSVRVRHGLVFAWKTEDFGTGSFKRVSFQLIVTRGSGGHDAGDTSGSYPVRLEGAGQEVEVTHARTYEQARRIGEEIARALNLPLLDATLLEGVERTPELLDETIVERLHRTGESVEWPGLPGNSRIRFDHLGDEIVIDQPRVSGSELRSNLVGVGVLLGLWLAAAIPGALFLRRLAGESTGSNWIRLAHAGLAALPFVPIVFVFMGSILLAVVRERIVVSPRRLRREWRLPLGRWSRELSAAEIEELREEGGDIIARGDRRHLQLGLMLSKSDRRWLKSAILCGLTGQRPR